ncbi:hypothetical protein BKP45_09670 [Anaerobacillus alkalidiazotrophicus]|uniref:Uncharacterized protein n=1 Tax=Anaerobacillus alkalidiazotrophicus TaxID=472963 RepID=A0A1S2M725_9BACI|nr:hypothetical protein [Anaerobacillus alkalidiazotrophicus]OIJ20323.1 hypothetical protein BKP45_09670 [Anaerobacillus alkalidiazotrophicus]
MNKVHFMHLFTICVYLVIGISIGLAFDKDWLKEEQMTYVQQLKNENALLQEEKEAWVNYVEDEINQIKIFAKADKENLQDLMNVFSNIGIKLEELPETMGIYQQNGIIVSLGEELEETYGLPHLSLEKIPNHETDLTIMYLSLLRLKEELSNEIVN